MAHLTRRRALALGGAGLVSPGLGWADPASPPLPKPNTQHAVLPFALTRNRPWTGVMINTQGAFPFLIDTAANWYLIDPGLADRLGLKKMGWSTREHTPGGRVDLPVYTAQDIGIGGGVHDYYVPMVGLRQDDQDITKGMIPASINRVMTLDFEQGRINVDAELASLPDGVSTFDLLNARGEQTGSNSRTAFTGRQPIIWAELDGKPLRLVIDTGEPDVLCLFPQYVREHGLWTHYPKSVPASQQTRAGIVHTRLVRAERLALGGFAFDKPVIQLSDPKGPDVIIDPLKQLHNDDPLGIGISSIYQPNHADGRLGVEMLRRMMVILDPSRRRMALKPNRFFDDIYRYDRAGLGIGREGKAIVVTEVADGGPAWRAGLRKGDQVLAWAGENDKSQPGPYFGLLWALQGKPGSLVEIQAQSEGKTAVFPITLEERV